MKCLVVERSDIGQARIRDPFCQLVWYDDFNGAQVDTNKWVVRSGGWNPEWHLAANVEVANSNLIITVKKEDYDVLHYTSGMIHTQGKACWTYGRFEIKAKVPYLYWPAIWMLNNERGGGVTAAWDSDYPGGEIDILEPWYDQPNMTRHALVYGDPPYANFSSYTLPDGNYADDYHIYAVEWDINRIRWYVDGILSKEETNWFTSRYPYPAPYNKPFFLIINLGINENSNYPAQMLVDWVKVWQ